MSNVTVTDSSCLRMDSRVPLVPLILFLQSYLQLLRECRGKLFVIMTSIVRLSSNRSYGQVKVKVKTVYKPIVAHQAGAYPGFRMKRLRVFYSPLVGMLVHRRVTPLLTMARKSFSISAKVILAYESIIHILRTWRNFCRSVY